MLEGDLGGGDEDVLDGGVEALQHGEVEQLAVLGCGCGGIPRRLGQWQALDLRERSNGVGNRCKEK
jgi:hypothetical protein